MGGFVAPRGPITQEEFGKLSAVEIADKLRTTWTPEELSRHRTREDFLSPINAEGMGDLLRSDVRKRLQDYAEHASWFFEPSMLDIHYTYSFLRGVKEAIEGDKEETSRIDWHCIVNLLVSIKQHAEKETFTRGELEERSASDAWLVGWNSVFCHIIDVIVVLLEKGQDDSVIIDFSRYRQQLFNVIGYFLTYPDPRPEDEQLETAGMKTKAPGSPEYKVVDPFMIAINSVRGRAFRAFVLFVYHDDEKFNKADERRVDTDVKHLYESTLQEENTRAIMFMFGHNLPTFYFGDKEWCRGLLPNVFPGSSEEQHLFTAAWEGYLANSVYEELFFDPQVQQLYERAITLEDPTDLEQEHFKPLDEGVAIHFALAYTHYEEFDIEHELLKKF